MKRGKSCGAWKGCAYYAYTKFQSPDGKREMWICSNCSRLYKLDGWKPIETISTLGSTQGSGDSDPGVRA